MGLIPLLDDSLFRDILITGRNFDMQTDFIWILHDLEPRVTYRNNLYPVHWKEKKVTVLGDAYLNEAGEQVYNGNNRQSLLNKEEFYSMKEGLDVNGYANTFFLWFIDIRDGFIFVDFADRINKHHGYPICEAFKKPI